MMLDFPTILWTALKGFLALSALGCSLIFGWLAWVVWRIMREDARDEQVTGAPAATREAQAEPETAAAEPLVPGETLIELDGAVFTAAEIAALDTRRRHWLMVPVKAR